LSLVATSIPTVKMSKGSSLVCNKDVKVVHATEPMKKKSALATIIASENGGVTIKCYWFLDNWKSNITLQQPTYPKPQALEGILNTLKSFPPLVCARQAKSLGKKLGHTTHGKVFLLQGGDYF